MTPRSPVRGSWPRRLNLSQLKGYRTGGTVHIVVNNQIGFTTSPVDSRSTRYCTDVAKMIEVPIFHVNGDDPEAVVYVAELALDFRETFGQDVVIDLVCYRKHGHNENDEPAFTQPLMYAAIQKRKTIRGLYTEKLIASGELSQEEADTIAETFSDKLQAVYEEVHDHAAKIAATPGFGGPWKGLKPGYSFAPTETGVPAETLKQIAIKTATIPEGFLVNPKIKRQLDARLKTIETGEGIDWDSARRWPSGRSWPRALRSGFPARIADEGRSAIVTPCSSMGTRLTPTFRSTRSPTTAPRSASTTAFCPRRRSLASITVTRSTSRTC